MRDIEQTKQTFRRLLAADAGHDEIINLLVPFSKADDLSPDDKGWVLWNLCDRFAMLRDVQNQYRYQSEFHEWSQAGLPALRLHWVVSDGTQANTLIQGGYLESWWRWYEFANTHCPREADNRTVRFESHRANAAAYTHFCEIDRAENVLNVIRDLLAEDTTWLNRDFAATAFRTLIINHYNVQGKANKIRQEADHLMHDLDTWLSHVRSTEETAHEAPLLGSWDQLNEDRPSSAVYVAIHNAGIALVESEQFDHAERLFRILLDAGRPLTSYGQSQYLLACWENRHDKEEVRTLLQLLSGISADKLRLWAPALNQVLV